MSYIFSELFLGFLNGSYLDRGAPGCCCCICMSLWAGIVMEGYCLVYLEFGGGSTGDRTPSPTWLTLLSPIVIPFPPIPPPMELSLLSEGTDLDAWMRDWLRGCPWWKPPSPISWFCSRKTFEGRSRSLIRRGAVNPPADARNKTWYY